MKMLVNLRQTEDENNNKKKSKKPVDYVIEFVYIHVPFRLLLTSLILHYEICMHNYTCTFLIGSSYFKNHPIQYIAYWLKKSQLYV